MEPGTGGSTLPQDVLPHIFRALRLNTTKQRDVINMITKDFTTIEEIKKYVTDRMLFFSMWERIFRKSELDYKASLNRDNHSGRTHAAGAMGGTSEGGEKRPKFQGRNKKKLGNNEGVDQSSDKSFGGAGFGGKADINGSKAKNKSGGALPRCQLCDVQGQPTAGHWTGGCPQLGPGQRNNLKAKHVCLGCLRWKARGVKHVCPRWFYEDGNAEFCQNCKVNTKLCDSPASHTPTPIPPTFNGAALGRPAVAAPQGVAATVPGESQSQGGNSRRPDELQGPPPDHQLNVAILAMQAGESPPAKNRGQLGHPAPLTSQVTLKKGGQTMLVSCLFDSG